MNNYKFQISVQAENEQDATTKLQAASVLLQKLKTNEIKKLADTVKNDPVKTTLAKKYLGL